MGPDLGHKRRRRQDLLAWSLTKWHTHGLGTLGLTSSGCLNPTRMAAPGVGIPRLSHQGHARGLCSQHKIHSLQRLEFPGPSPATTLFLSFWKLGAKPVVDWTGMLEGLVRSSTG